MVLLMVHDFQVSAFHFGNVAKQHNSGVRDGIVVPMINGPHGSGDAQVDLFKGNRDVRFANAKMKIVAS